MDVHLQPLVHYPFIPLLLVLGMTLTGELAAILVIFTSTASWTREIC